MPTLIKLNFLNDAFFYIEALNRFEQRLPSLEALDSRGITLEHDAYEAIAVERKLDRLKKSIDELEEYLKSLALKET